MFLNYEPGDFVINPKNKDWGTGQIQSVIKNKVTVNFENVGKKVINGKEIILERINKIEWFKFKKYYWRSYRHFLRGGKNCKKNLSAGSKSYD